MDRAPRLPDGAIANTVRPLGSTPDNPFLVDENGHFGLTRSTAENPFLVDENGEFVRSLSGALKRSPSHGRSPVKRSPSARPYRMYGAPNGGPPSIIRQDIPRRRMRRSQTTDRPYLRALALAGHPLPPTFATPAPGDASGSTSAAGTSTGAASAQKPVKKSLFRSSGATPLRLRKRKTPRQGFRTPRDTPFNVKDLYLTDARPPADSDPLPHHECSVCYNIKSHPVAYRCGHSHCYVCVREWLETSWECPFCRAEIRDEPMCSDDAKRAIAFDHPDWQDHSLVSYSWEGLYFPE